MYNNNSNSHHNKCYTSQPTLASRCSVLDNIGTFRHFYDSNETNHRHKKDFYILYYRRKNLLLKHKLENCSLSYNPTIQKVCKNLACCSSLSEVTDYQNTEVHVSKTSKKCKSKYCLICSRIESNKNARKFINKVTDPEHEEFFKPRHYYFLTLTVKHNDEVRTDNYLKQFKEYVNKLQRSLIYRNYFIRSTDKNNYGAMSSTEMTISKGQYHIHNHSLICCLPLIRKVSEIELELKLAWKKITGDSDQIRLDLVKNYNPTDSDNPDENDNSALNSACAEIFKYVVKSDSLNNLSSGHTDLMAQWIIDTKGKNFINALGYFRKLGLIRRLKKSDNNEAAPLDDPINSVLLTKTISIDSNANMNFNYSKNARKDVLKYFKITGISSKFADVTDIKDDIGSILKDFTTDTIIDTFIDSELNKIRQINMEFDDWDNKFSNDSNYSHSRASNVADYEILEAPF